MISSPRLLNERADRELISSRTKLTSPQKPPYSILVFLFFFLLLRNISATFHLKPVHCYVLIRIPCVIHKTQTTHSNTKSTSYMTKKRRKREHKLPTLRISIFTRNSSCEEKPTKTLSKHDVNVPLIPLYMQNQ